MNILGFAGRRLSGKNEASDIVVEFMPTFQQASFAQLAKLDYCALKGITIADFIGNKEKYRKGLIEYTKEIKKDDRFFYARKLFEHFSDEDNIVISDVRFIEELQEIKIRGGVVYKIESSDDARAERGYKFNPAVDLDISETELDLSSYTYHCLGGGIIHNNSCKNSLRRDIYKLLEKNFSHLKYSYTA